MAELSGEENATAMSSGAMKVDKNQQKENAKKKKPAIMEDQCTETDIALKCTFEDKLPEQFDDCGAAFWFAVHEKLEETIKKLRLETDQVLGMLEEENKKLCSLRTEINGLISSTINKLRDAQDT